MEKKPPLRRSLGDTVDIKESSNRSKARAALVSGGDAIISRVDKVEDGHHSILSQVDVSVTPEKASPKAQAVITSESRAPP